MASALHRLFAARKAKQAKRKLQHQQHQQQTEPFRNRLGQASQSLGSNGPLHNGFANVEGGRPPLITTQSLNRTGSVAGGQRSSIDSRSMLSASSPTKAHFEVGNRNSVGSQKSSQDCARDGLTRRLDHLHLEGAREESRNVERGAALKASELEDEDPTASIIYQKIMEHPVLSHDVRLVILPSVKAMAFESSETLAFDPHWVALHAFRPSKLFKDVFVSCTAQDHSPTAKQSLWQGVKVTAVFDPVGFVDLKFRHERNRAQWHKRLEISTETSVYRSAKRSRGEGGHPRTSSSDAFSRPSVQSSSRKIEIVVVKEGLLLSSEVSDREGAAIVHSGSQMGTTTKPTARDVDSPVSVQDFGQPRPPGSAILSHLDSTATNAQVPWITSSPGHQSPQSLVEGSARFIVSPPLDDCYRGSLSADRASIWKDLLALVDPPVTLQTFSAHLLSAHRTLIKLTKEFTATFVICPGFEDYNRRKLREGILNKAWNCFERDSIEHQILEAVSAETQRQIYLMLENAMFAYAHDHVYGSFASSSTLTAADARLSSILSAYRQDRVDLHRLGATTAYLLRRPHKMDGSIQLMRSWSTSSQQVFMKDTSSALHEMLSDPQSHAEVIRRLALDDHFSYSPANFPLVWDADDESSALMDLRSFNKFAFASAVTPLDGLALLGATTDAVLAAASRGLDPTFVGSPLSSSSSLQSREWSSVKAEQSANSLLTTDELIPLLAHIVIQAQPENLLTRLRYIRFFGISGHIRPEQEWALVMFEAVAEWLVSDPLKVESHAGTALQHRRPVAARSASASRSLLSDQGHGKPDQDALVVDTRNEPSGSLQDRSRRLSLPAEMLLKSPDRPTEGVNFARTRYNFNGGTMSRSNTNQSTSSRSSNGSRQGTSLPLAQDQASKTGQSIIEQSLADGKRYSKDLTIRPQIVTRPRVLRRPTAPMADWAAGRESEAQSPQGEVLDASQLLVNRERVSSIGMSRVESENSALKSAAGTSNRSPTRRRSFGSASILSAAETTLPQSPCSSDEGGSNAPSSSGYATKSGAVSTSRYLTSTEAPKSSSWLSWSTVLSSGAADVHGAASSTSGFSQISDPSSSFSRVSARSDIGNFTASSPQYSADLPSFASLMPPSKFSTRLPAAVVDGVHADQQDPADEPRTPTATTTPKRSSFSRSQTTPLSATTLNAASQGLKDSTFHRDRETNRRVEDNLAPRNRKRSLLLTKDDIGAGLVPLPPQLVTSGQDGILWRNNPSSPSLASSLLARPSSSTPFRRHHHSRSEAMASLAAHTAAPK